MTSKDTPVGGGLKLAVKRATPNQGGSALVGPKSQEEVIMKQKPKKQTAEEKKKTNAAAAAVTSDSAPTAERVRTQEVKQPSNFHSLKRAVPRSQGEVETHPPTRFSALFNSKTWPLRTKSSRGESEIRHMNFRTPKRLCRRNKPRGNQLPSRIFY